jgi:hypothetical protein
MKNEDEFEICSECFTDQIIRSKIIENHSNVMECDFCGNRGVPGINQDEIELISNYCQAYVVYNFSQDNWDGRYGKRSYIDTVISENLFVDWPKIKKLNKYGYFADVLSDVDHGNLLILFDHWAGEASIKATINNSKLSQTISEDDFSEKIKSISSIVDDLEKTIIVKTGFIQGYRARIGFNVIENEYGVNKFIPFDNEEIGVAPRKSIQSGRANRAYCSFLYLSDNADTCLLEVRSKKSDKVSVGMFCSNRELKIFDLTNPNIWDFKNSYKQVEELRLLAAINNLFSKPTGSHDEDIYLETQLIVEEIIRRGFDGICFSSSFDGNSNYTIFSKSLCSYVQNSAKLYEITGIKVTSKIVK